MSFFLGWAFWPLWALRPTRPYARGCSAMPDLILGGVVAAALMIYLLVALLRPERF
jgi:K+-transporting ATPase KdpF subunit